jgi:hypothetical protein
MTHSGLQHATVACQYFSFLCVQNPKGKNHTFTLILRILCGREYRHIFTLFKSPDKVIQTDPDYFWHTVNSKPKLSELNIM